MRFVYGGSTVVQQATFFRKQAFEEAGGFNTKNYTSWDVELLLDFWRLGKQFRRIDRHWGLFTIHLTSISGSQKFQKESVKNHRRYFETVLGRKKRWYDQLIRYYFWLNKWFLDPISFLYRIQDTISSPSLPQGRLLW